MVHYSVLIPVRDAADALSRQLPQLGRVLDGLLLPYEIICIDDASEPPAAGSLQNLFAENANLRVLRFDEPRGTGAALTAGLAAARGDLVIAADLKALGFARYIPHLIARLSRHDLVIARRERPLREEFWHRVARVPRLIAATSQSQPTEDLFWAARHEAVGGLALARGAFRILGKIVARRGFRVCRLRLAAGVPPHGAAYRAGLIDRLAGCWLERRFEPHVASEMVRVDGPEPYPVPTPGHAARPRYVPQPVFTPVQKHSGDSA